MAGFRLTKAAETDLKAIARYTHQRWGRKQRNKYPRELDQAFERIAANPGLGTRRDEIREGHLSFLRNRHLIFYRVRKGHVEIVRVLHHRMDIETLLE